MAIDISMEPMLEAFIFETVTLLEQLDEIMLDSEKSKNFSAENISEIFRIMHTIKGSSAMMGLGSMSTLAHAVEDVFFIIREKPEHANHLDEEIFDLVFSALDFLKSDMELIRQNNDTDSNPEEIIAKLHTFAAKLSGKPVPVANTAATSPNEATQNSDHYRIKIFFEDDCQMENLRAFMLITHLHDYCTSITSDPQNPESNKDFSSHIIANGLVLIIKPLPNVSIEDILRVLGSTLNIKTYELIYSPPAGAEATETYDQAEDAGAPSQITDNAAMKDPAKQAGSRASVQQSFISVNQAKLDQLMDLVGELVTTESMLIGSQDLKGLRLDNFHKSTRELLKLTDELQDVVMSIRMVPLSGVFQKMNRIVRDMCKKLDKQAELITIGGETEVDKTINEAIVDPFMHMVRNALDHAIEDPAERIKLGKPAEGQVTISAKNVGGEIIITIADDGRGLDREKLLSKAKTNGLLTKPENEYTDREVFGFIMHAGFSTNKAVTEFSGRGVGMDVVRQNIQKVGGSVFIDSAKGKGTVFTIKIPLTLAIVDGMELKVGENILTMPITTIQQSFKLSPETQVLTNTDGSEMIMIGGKCYPFIRLHKLFGYENAVENLEEGIIIQIENSSSTACIFADELLGEQQVVVKSFPAFLNKYNVKNMGFSGCTILGDGSISLILDANNLIAGASPN